MDPGATATVPVVQPVTRDEIAALIGVTPRSLEIIIDRAKKRGDEVPPPINPGGGLVYDEDDWLRWAARTGRADRIEDPVKRRRAQRLAKADRPPDP